MHLLLSALRYRRGELPGFAGGERVAKKRSGMMECPEFGPKRTKVDGWHPTANGSARLLMSTGTISGEYRYHFRR